VPRKQEADHLTAPHVLTAADRGIHRFEAGQHATVRDRQDGPVDHDAGEMHDAVGGGADRRPGGTGDVDAAVTRSVRRRRGEERAHDRVRCRQRPGPRSGGDQHGEEEVHADSVRARSRATGRGGEISG
jgi:hypothetical protein